MPRPHRKRAWKELTRRHVLRQQDSAVSNRPLPARDKNNDKQSQRKSVATQFEPRPCHARCKQHEWPSKRHTRACEFMYHVSERVSGGNGVWPTVLRVYAATRGLACHFLLHHTTPLLLNVSLHGVALCFTYYDGPVQQREPLAGPPKFPHEETNNAPIKPPTFLLERSTDTPTPGNASSWT